jgi:predicted deacylase
MLEQYLSQFSSLLTTTDTPWSRRHVGGRHGRRVVLGLMIHGDEVGSLPGALAVMAELSSGALSYGGIADFFIGNVPAARAGMRCIEADLNRVFTDAAPDTAERRRAEELSRLLDGCDLFLDLHQTALPAARPFFTLPWRPLEARWVRALRTDAAWITRPSGVSFSPGLRCADEYVRDQGRPGITLELGEQGFSPAATAASAAVIRRTLALMDAVDEQGDAVLTGPLPPCYRYSHAEPYTNRTLRLRPGLVNFQPVAAGEVLSAPGTPTLRAPTDGVLLFPKYPADDAILPATIFRLAAPLPQPPAVLWGG